MYDMIIIGAGTAGLTAAVYGVRAGRRVLVLEEKVYGGQILSAVEVENYPGIRRISGYEFAENLYRQATELGVELKYEKALKIQEKKGEKLVVTGRAGYPCRTVILATGARNRKLGLDREEELTGRGISYCATCDGAFFRGRDVAVVGGGDVAVEDAIYLARMCRKVWLVHRRDSLRAAKSLQEKLTACGNVQILWNRTLASVSGSDLVEKVTLQNVTDAAQEELSVDGVFIAVGMRPNTEVFCDVVPCDDRGYVLAGEDCVTRVPGIFAAGDIRTKQVRQIITAVADGACAVASVEKYLNAL